MANLTLRNIPEHLLERIRSLSIAERRSLNNEILVLLERALREYTAEIDDDIFIEAQVDLWSKLAGEWEDPRSTDEIIAEIINNRSPGREVKL
ncbi:MAG TPA: hypothetical protein GX004_03205 [Firmicutes bacterium]|jgi:plasmid stability protein|nr:hypothetical protein [Bacillota bacterium]